MKKLQYKLICIIIIASGWQTIQAQNVAINADGAAPDASAMLDVKSTTKGLLVPRMTAAQRVAISSPATGLIVYQTDGTAGYYYYDGGWVMLMNTDASNLASGTVPTARLGSGTADNTTFLRGDGTWSTPAGGSSPVLQLEVAQSTSAQTFTASGTNILQYGTPTTNVSNQFASNKFTAASSGVYLITVSVGLGGGNGTGAIGIKKNGTLLSSGTLPGGAYSASYAQRNGAACTIVSLDANDYIEIEIASPSTAFTADGKGGYLSILKL